MTVPVSLFHRFSVRVLLGGALLSVLFVGCDSLDVEDPNAPSAQDVTVQSLVTGTEGAMREDIDIFTQVVSILGREAYYFEPADPRYTGELYTGPLDPNGFLLTRHWNARYRTIRNATTLLERAPELDAPARAGAEAYAKTVIGYQLLLALDYLWDNGIKVEFSDDITTPFVSRAVALETIEQYLDEASVQLEEAGDAFSFRLSAGFDGFDTPQTFNLFNRALRARVAIYGNDAQGALDALADSFVDRDGDLEDGVYHVFASASGDRTNLLFEVPTSSSVKLRAHPTFKADAEVGDRRVVNKVLDRTDETGFPASPSAANGLSSRLVVTLYDGSTAPIPLIRNEELLLLRAEALIGQQRYDEAEADLNRVRAAAELAPVDLTAANALDQLLYERRYSLFLEGHRWVDLRRYERLDTLPLDQVGEPLRPGRIFRQMPRPLDEVPET
jgi:hypothetical protein